MFEGSTRRFGVTTNISGLSHGIVVNNISFSDSLDSAEARDHNGNIIDIAVYGENEQVSIDGVYVGDGVEAGTIIKVDDKNFLVTSTGRNEINTAFQTASVNARYYPGQEPPIPPGPEPPVYQPLTFKAVGSGSTKIKIGQTGHPSAITLDYKLNDGDWTPYTIEDMINLNQNDTIAFSGANDHFSNNVGNYFFYADNGPIEASGNIMSLMNFSDTCTPYCFRSLFKYFSPLTSAPQLPATTLANSCYSEMFYRCQYLSTAPQLPATGLAYWCYANMFQDCLALTAAPQLPATELADHCYYRMFYNCQNLSTAPSILPATSLAYNCYEGMFNTCLALTSAPILPATGLVGECYQDMFYQCRNLSSINVDFTDWNVPNATYYWVASVAPTGIFYKPSALSAEYDDSRIPWDWQVVNKEDLIPLTFKSTNGIGGVALNQYGTPYVITLQYNKNNTGWTNYTLGQTVILNQNDTVAFSGANDHFSKATNDFYYFSMGGQIEANGNIMSLMNFSNSCTNYCFYRLFLNCTDLKVAPSLPATTLADNCYKAMFGGCTSLTSAPELQVTQLKSSCYSNMFNGCSGLIEAPNLPASTLAIDCYNYMFANCTSLTDAPYLPAKTLTITCYNSMFDGCSSLSSISVEFTNWNQTYSTLNWVRNVAQNGTFIKPSGLSEEYGDSRIPTNWQVVNKDQPVPPEPNPSLSFKAVNGGANILLSAIGSPNPIDLSYKINNGSWSSYTIGDTISLNENDIVYMSGANSLFSKDLMNYYHFVMTGSIEAGGNIQSLLNFSNSVPSCGFIQLFYSQPSLIKAPDLPATQLDFQSYFAMFQGCTSLTDAPQIPSSLAIGCYSTMFYRCTSLSSINVNFTTWDSMYTGNWVQNVASTGIFYKPAALSTEYGDSRIPTNWQVVNKDQPVPPEPNPSLSFKGLSSSNAVQLKQIGSPDPITLEYSKNNGAWTTYNIGDTILLDQDDVVYLSGNNNHFSKSYSDYYIFGMTGSIEAGGNTMSLMNFSDSLTNYGFDYLFFHCDALLTAPALPATNLAEACYRYMFTFCWHLSAAPQLPATTLANGCYDGMFFACDNLSSINVSFTEWGNGFGNWVQSVGANGTFYKPAALSQQYGFNYIPSGWTVVNK